MANTKVGVDIVANTGDANAKVKQVGGSVKQLGNTSAETNKKMAAMSSQFTRIRSQLSLLTGGFVSVYGAIRVFGKTIDILASFDHAMKEVGAISKANTAEFADLRAKAIELGESTVHTQTQVAQGMKFLAMAGLESGQILKTIGPTLDLATASGIGLARAADISTNVMTAFGIEAQHSAAVMDDLITILHSSNTNMTQLGDAIKYVGPIASTLGIPLKNVAAAVGTLSNAGLQGSMAGTGLRMTLMRLVDPSREAGEALARLGINSNDVNPALVGLEAALKKLSTAQGLATEAVNIFGIRQAAAAQVLIRGLDTYGSLNAALEANSGAAREAAEEMGSSLKSAITMLGSAVAGLIQGIGDAGLTSVIRFLVDVITNLTRHLKDVVDFMQEFKAVGMAVDAVIKAMSASFGAFITLITGGMIIKGLKAMQAAMATTFGTIASGAGVAAVKVTLLSKAMTFLRMSMMRLASITIIGIAIVAVGMALGELIVNLSGANEEIEKLEENMDSLSPENIASEMKHSSKLVTKAIQGGSTPDVAEGGDTARIDSILNQQVQGIDKSDSLFSKLASETKALNELSKIKPEGFGDELMKEQLEHAGIVSLQKEKVSLIQQEIQAHRFNNQGLAEELEKKREIAQLDIQELQAIQAQRRGGFLNRGANAQTAFIEERAIKEQELASIRDRNNKESHDKERKLAEKNRKEQLASQRGQRDLDISFFREQAKLKDKFGRKTPQAKEAEEELKRLNKEKVVADHIKKGFEAMPKGLRGTQEGNLHMMDVRREAQMLGDIYEQNQRKPLGLGVDGVSSLAAIGGGGGVGKVLDVEAQANNLRQRTVDSLERQERVQIKTFDLFRGIEEAIKGNSNFVFRKT